MRASIEVDSRAEADNIRAGLEDQHVRAFVTVMGALLRLPDTDSRKRVLDFVSSHFKVPAP